MTSQLSLRLRFALLLGVLFALLALCVLPVVASFAQSVTSANQTIRYVYDGKLVIQERSGANTPLVSYTRGRDLSGGAQQAGGIGGLLARTEHGAATPQLATSIYHADGNGNITALLSTNQLVVAYYSYDPYGNVIAQTGPLADANVYRFSSKEQHVNSGLVYYGYRFYEPKFQRWLNRDPKGETGGLNLFGFNRRNPVSYVDPFGLSTDDDELDRITSGDVLTPLSPYLPGVPTDQLSEVLCDLGNSLLDPEEWQDALAVVEPVPVVGDLASAMNTAIDVSQGNYTMAVMGVAATFTPLPGPRTFKNAAQSVATPYGPAVQSMTAEARAALSQVENGAMLYKGGVLGRSETGASQFLSLENPLNPGYAGRYGLPPQNANFEFIMTGRVQPGAPVITRPAPGIPPNPGGGIGAVTTPGSFRIDSFYMP